MAEEQVWTVKAALDWCVAYLSEKGDEHPRRSAEWLLSSATGLSRVEIYAFHDRPLSPEERTALRDAVRRRASGEPLQYVTGEVAFRHLVLKVRPGVLIPRPETEVLVGEALAELSALEAPLVVDVGVGSGAIALSIAQEHSAAAVYATDASRDAVAVASENAERLGLSERVRFFEGDLLGPLPAELRGSVDAVVSNPPYIPSALMPVLPSEVIGFEPHLALDGGEDGLEVFRRLAEQASEWLKPGGLLAVELHESRLQRAAEEAVQWYQGIRVVPDLTGRDRILLARNRMAT